MYRDKPIYRTKYYYTIWRWKYDRTETAEGGGKTPEYPDPQLTDKERLGKKSVDCFVTFARLRVLKSLLYDTHYLLRVSLDFICLTYVKFVIYRLFNFICLFLILHFTCDFIFN